MFDGYFEVLAVADDIVTIISRSLIGVGQIECVDLPAHAFTLDGVNLEPGAMGVVQKVFMRPANKVMCFVTLAVGPHGAFG